MPWITMFGRCLLSSRWVAAAPLFVILTLPLAEHPRLDYAAGYTIAYVGVLSYSIYIWQQPFLNRGSASLFSSFPLNIAGAFAAALLSYYLIEQPMLRVRRRFTRALGSFDGAGAVAPAEAPATESA